ncbi:hypothetical protein WICPIJ_001155 [Wickerhamomyces pijperi]|uniref:Transcription initiation factor TFIID subunit 1 histone acetyltransferase domain-containing protein n=1 Tax=Wickerhamomyces pijperi TaxID=599730 RepID=A0A9P8QC52_WICPI|nr:hypothetical protein WICPIJ_001155 [Wickerhamomyces pijperi]
MAGNKGKAQKDITNENDALDAALGGGSYGAGGGLDFNHMFATMNTKHADDAIDFEDIDELADDELPEEEEPSSAASKPVKTHTDPDELFNDDDDFFNDLNDESKQTMNDNDDQFDLLFSNKVDDGFIHHDSNIFDDFEKSSKPASAGNKSISFDGTTTLHSAAKNASSTKKQSNAPKTAKQIEEDKEHKRFQEKLLQSYFPAFKKGAVLKMNSVFGPKPTYYQYNQPLNPIKPLIPTKISLEVQPDQRRVFKSSLHHHVNDNGKRIVPLEFDSEESKSSKKQKAIKIEEDLMLASVDWDYDKIVGDMEEAAEAAAAAAEQPKIQEIEKDYERLLDDYDDDAILEGHLSTKLQLDLNDRHLLFVEHREKESKNIEKLIAIPTNEQLLLSKFNISNDKNYHLLKENYHSKIRSTIGNLNIEHSSPAFRLQSPHYKVKLRKEWLRAPHRDTFRSKSGQLMQFSKLKTRKRKKDKYKDIKELYNKTTDLTLADSGQTVLMEHSEETPIVIPGYGMGSKLINYYRKINEEDTSRNKMVIGETHVLGVQDKSPFWNFGFVEPGNSVPTLYNKLIRAPIFSHEAAQTDFLLIKNSGAGSGPRFYLKQITNLFLIGQLLPVVDIPGPHSRKVTTAAKNRLKMIVYRILKRKPGNRLLVKDISSHFPDQNDMQNRQRLKEFMEYQRTGPDQGFWKLKEELPHDHLISPEDLTLLEAMHVSQQNMEDLQFYSMEDEEVNDELAMWNLTKNFINATQGKAMLQLNGDPEGKAISFMKTSMKGGFKSFESNGHSYNVALQQKAYDEEISRQWYSQQKRFSGNEPAFTELEKHFEAEEAANAKEEEKKKAKKSSKKGKFLRITRLVLDKNGIKQRKHEILRDPELINAYIKRREKLEQDIIPDEINISNDAEKNLKLKRNLQEQLAKLQKNQERRNARKASKLEAAINAQQEDPTKSKSNTPAATGAAAAVANDSQGDIDDLNKATIRRCATCGATGHIRTNKSCPMYHEAGNNN